MIERNNLIIIASPNKIHPSSIIITEKGSSGVPENVFVICRDYKHFNYFWRHEVERHPEKLLNKKLIYIQDFCGSTSEMKLRDAVAGTRGGYYIEYTLNERDFEAAIFGHYRRDLFESRNIKKLEL